MSEPLERLADELEAVAAKLRALRGEPGRLLAVDRLVAEPMGDRIEAVRDLG